MKRKVIILTGFLGSGKTTLLRGVLSKVKDRTSVFVVMNELGEASLEYHLVRELSENVRFLGGGCACCNIREDLVKILNDVLSLEMRGEIPAPEYVIIETSGLSDPSPVSFTITTDPVLQHHYKMHKIITTVSSVNGERVLETSPESRKQLMTADFIVLTKTDIVPKSDRLVSKIKSLNPVAEIAEAAMGEMNPDTFFSETGHLQMLNLKSVDDGLKRSEVLSIVFEDEVDWAVFGVWLSSLLYAHGENILRVKAALNIGGGDFILVNGVQHVIHSPEHLRASPYEKSRLLIVSRDIDADRILDSFQVFHNTFGKSDRLGFGLAKHVVHG
ncbi:MAG: GTP-binding protein [Candidatus Caldarchaeum sp.]|nr:GTP-binding protein [Candidatus Caldarchaeum sp.]